MNPVDRILNENKVGHFALIVNGKDANTDFMNVSLAQAMGIAKTMVKPNDEVFIQDSNTRERYSLK